MNELESLALLIADLNAQVRALHAENAELREAAVSRPKEEWKDTELQVSVSQK